jgi:hypothetical protein
MLSLIYFSLHPNCSQLRLPNFLPGRLRARLRHGRQDVQQRVPAQDGVLQDRKCCLRRLRRRVRQFREAAEPEQQK